MPLILPRLLPPMDQVWTKLLFAHWPIAPAIIQKLLPPGLMVDTIDGNAWLSVVPFELRYQFSPLRFTRYRHRFLELNLRTYAHYNGEPGVYFFCLDATDWVSVIGARQFFHLAYNKAVADLRQSGKTYDYQSRRVNPGMTSVGVNVRYTPTGPAAIAPPGSLDDWLTARFAFFSASRAGRIYRGRVRHAPWQLQPVEVQFQENTLGEPHGLDLSAPPALMHYSEQLDVQAWPVELV